MSFKIRELKATRGRRMKSNWHHLFLMTILLVTRKSSGNEIGSQTKLPWWLNMVSCFLSRTDIYHATVFKLTNFDLTSQLDAPVIHQAKTLIFYQYEKRKASRRLRGSVNEKDFLTCSHLGKGWYQLVNSTLHLIPDVYTGYKLGVDVKNLVNKRPSNLAEINASDCWDYAVGRPFPLWPLEDGNLIYTEKQTGEYYFRKGELHYITSSQAKKLLRIPWYHKRGKVNNATIESKPIGSPITTTFFDFDDAPERPGLP